MKKAKEFKVIECSGTPYEIGRQWGEGCRENFVKSLELNFGAMGFGYKAAKEEVISNARKYIHIVKKYDPDLIDLLKGQSEAAGVSFEEVFTLRCIFEFIIYYNQIRGMCTSFAATGEATKDGKTLLGQNIDWMPGMPLDLLKIRYNDGSSQIALSLGHSIEYILSSHSFGICANATFGQDYSMNIPVGCYLPKVMRQNTVNDAIDELKRVARGLGYYHLASSTGEIIGIESSTDDYEIIKPEKNTLFHSNHYLTQRFKSQDMASIYVQDSFHRIERIKTLANQKYGNITPQLMMEILSDHDKHPKSVCSHETKQFPSTTLGSFIMVPEDGIMYIAYGNPCSHEYIEYRL